MKMMKSKSFTLVELVVVVVAVGIVAGFAIPSYQKAIERAHEREALNNLIVIHAASNAHRAETGTFWPSDNNNHLIADINNDLHLNLIENGMAYSCWGDGIAFLCSAVRNAPAASFTVTVDQNAIVIGGNPSCSAGACP